VRWARSSGWRCGRAARCRCCRRSSPSRRQVGEPVRLLRVSSGRSRFCYCPFPLPFERRRERQAADCGALSAGLDKTGRQRASKAAPSPFIWTLASFSTSKPELRWTPAALSPPASITLFPLFFTSPPHSSRFFVAGRPISLLPLSLPPYPSRYVPLDCHQERHHARLLPPPSACLGWYVLLEHSVGDSATELTRA
jgi:hypothetical protein